MRRLPQRVRGGPSCSGQSRRGGARVQLVKEDEAHVADESVWGAGGGGGAR